MHTAISIAQWYSSHHDDRALGALPFFHVTDMQICVNLPVYLGSTVIIMSRWNRDLAAKLIPRHRVTRWAAAPAMVIDLLSSPAAEQYDLSSLKSIGGGGTAMPEAIAAKLEHRFNITY